MASGLLNRATAAAVAALLVIALALGVDDPRPAASTATAPSPTATPTGDEVDAAPTPTGTDDTPASTPEPTSDDGGDPAADAVLALGRLSVITSFGGIPREGGEVTFELSISNAGETTVEIEDADVVLEGPDGPLERLTPLGEGFAPAELAPRESLTGTIAFRVPPDSEGLSLLVEPAGAVPVEIRL